MSKFDKPGSRRCDEIREELERAWSEGHLDEALRRRDAGDLPRADHLVRHLEECVRCQKEAESITGLDRFLGSGFQRMGETLLLPGEDQITQMLRQTRAHADVQVLQRIRRPLVTVLWIGFFAFTLMASCALGILVYRAIFRN